MEYRREYSQEFGKMIPGNEEKESLLNFWEANREVERLKERNAWLENVLRAVSAQCRWRETGLCDLDCPGRRFCDCEGLTVFQQGGERYAG